MATRTINPLDATPFSTEVTLHLDRPLELIDSDGEPLEGDWHRWAMNLLIDSVRQHLLGREDFYCGGNMFIYYNEQQARNRDYRGPDFFFVWGRPLHPPRPYRVVWEEEGHFPNVIVELMSSSTRHIDLGAKKTLYQNTFRTEDYFCYDPFTFELFGWTLTPDGYVALEPNEDGWLWCEQMQLWLGAVLCKVADHKNVYLRFMTADGKIVGSFADAARAEANEAERIAEEARQRAEQAENEVERLTTEAKRAAAEAQTEIARLKAALEAREQPPS